jgi:hypothetical protein
MIVERFKGGQLGRLGGSCRRRVSTVFIAVDWVKMRVKGERVPCWRRELKRGPCFLAHYWVKLKTRVEEERVPKILGVEHVFLPITKWSWRQEGTEFLGAAELKTTLVEWFPSSALTNPRALWVF